MPCLNHLVRTIVPYFKGRFRIRHILSLYIAASQLQSIKHAARHSSLVDNDRMERELSNCHSLLDIGSMVYVILPSLLLQLFAMNFLSQPKLHFSWLTLANPGMHEQLAVFTNISTKPIKATQALRVTLIIRRCPYL